MIEINGKIYRNLQEQVKKNQEDIEELQESTLDAYTKEESDNRYYTKEESNTKYYTKRESDTKYYTKTQANTNFVSKANLTDFSINDIIVGNSEIDGDDVNLRAVYSQNVKSEISLDPTSSIFRTMSGNDVSTIGISSNEIDLTTPMLKYNSNEVLSVDNENNIYRQMIRIGLITSTAGEDSDNKGKIYLDSGISRGSIELDADGEEHSASILVRGTSTVGSEGVVELHGKTQVYTNNRITVFNSNSNSEQIAYLSDLQSLIDRITALENNN